ncbi:MAG: catalase, partial [Actinoallomurus sp.]|nr:catalase [Actinoallomurus sp.]
MFVQPHPDREIPQARSAHDTFWDFVSLHTEATHHVMWAMSDRGIPGSYRTMEGFGVHTFRLVNAKGATALVKFHWKPIAGMHSLVREEAQIAAGADPDFHRRDMAEGIEAGAPLEYELGLQLLPEGPGEPRLLVEAVSGPTSRRGQPERFGRSPEARASSRIRRSQYRTSTIIGSSGGS